MKSLLDALQTARNQMLPAAHTKAHCQLSGAEVKLLDEISKFYSTRNHALRVALHLLYAAHQEAKQAEAKS